MKVFGTFLILFAVFVALAGFLEVVGPPLQGRGLDVSGVLYPRWLWIGLGVAALVAGVRLRRAASTGKQGVLSS